MKKILIIEDDEAIADILQDFLTINGFESRIVHDGAEGLKAALTKDYDLILLDVMLPTKLEVELWGVGGGVLMVGGIRSRCR